MLDRAEIEADVWQGTQRNAILFPCSANAAHGMRRANAHKRRAGLRLLDDAEWVAWSDREIARQCGVDHRFVGSLRPAPSLGTVPSEPRTYTTKHGTVAQMNVSRIGSAPRPAPEPAWTPSDIPPTEPTPSISPESGRQIARNKANAFISSALWEIERQLALLPPRPKASSGFQSAVATPV